MINFINFYNKYLKIAIRIIFIVLIIIILFYATVHPIISWCIETGYIDDVAYYNENRYIEDEYGMNFKTYIQSIEQLKSGTVTAFYYRDNWIQDNPIYGKACDITSVDIQLDDEQYNELISNNLMDDYEKYQFNTSDKFELFLPKQEIHSNYVIFFALNHEKNIFRAIMISDIDQIEAGNIPSLLIRYSHLSFQ